MEDIIAISDWEPGVGGPWKSYLDYMYDNRLDGPEWHSINSYDDVLEYRLEKEETELNRDRKELEIRAEEWKAWFEAVGDTSQDVGIRKTNL
jgi:hypothetical protein